MPCFAPLGAMIARVPSVDGKRAVRLIGKVKVDGSPWLPDEWEYGQLPCGSCDGCLLERSRQWAVRITHEASLSEQNCFVTLTYADEHLPANGGLWPEDFDAFMRALRQKIAPSRVRYFYCGEYGERFGRPHFHAVLFGWWPPDAECLGNRKGLPVWRSELIERLWKRGRTEVGTVTFESASYVARYVLKKRGKDGRSVDQSSVESGVDALRPRKEEYARMSRKPGIGRRWIEAFAGEVLAADSVVVRGREAKPPRFYDLVCAELAPEAVQANREARQRERDGVSSSVAGRYAGAVIAAQRVNLFARELE